MATFTRRLALTGVLLGILLAVVRADAAGAKAEGLKDLLSGTPFPLALQLKDLNSEWRRINVANAGDPAGLPRAYAAMLGGAAGGGVFYTKGETVNVEGQSYLIAYRLQTKPIDWQAMMRGGFGNKPPEPEKPTPESTVVLSLLHLATAGSISDIRPFNLEVELAGGDSSPAAIEEARDQAAKAAGLQDLRDLGQALLAYAKDGDKSLPPMKDAESARKALEPYVKNKETLARAEGKDLYQPNPALSGRKFAEIEKPGDVVAFYESKPANDSRGVLYLDGRVERIAESKWRELKKAAKIP